MLQGEESKGIVCRGLDAMKKENSMERRIVAIIGSSKFKDHHLGAAQRETLRGNIVLLAGFWHHRDMVPISDEQKERIDTLMLDKIALATETLVINLNGYVGKSTLRGIEHAKLLGRPVRYLEPES